MKTSIEDFLKLRYHLSDKRYDPFCRAQDFIEVIDTIKRDGLKIICRNSEIIIENTVSNEKAIIYFEENGSVNLYSKNIMI